jgi:hypothetical protein
MRLVGAPEGRLRARQAYFLLIHSRKVWKTGLFSSIAVAQPMPKSHSPGERGTYM